MRYYIFLLGILIIAISQAQENCDKTIRGVVLDYETHEPLPLATVRIEDSEKGAVTNNKGQFIIQNVCETEVHLEISFIGYKTVIHHHDDRHADPTILMVQDHVELKGVVIEEQQDKTQFETIAYDKKNIDFTDRNLNSVGDLSSSMSGVSTVRIGQNAVKPMIHGLHSNRVLIINNGIRHSYQGWGRDHAPEIDASAVDQITVVKGAATVRYGPEALGGVILFDQKKPSFDEALNASLLTHYQTNGNGYGGSFSVTKGSHRVAWGAGVSGTRSGDLSAPYYSLTNTGKKESGAYLNGRLHLEKWDFEVFMSHYDQELGILRGSVVGNLEDLVVAMQTEPPAETGSFSYSIRNPRQATAHTLLKGKASYYPGEHEINLQYAFQKNIRQEFDIRRGTNNDRPSIDLELNSHSIEIDWKQPTSKSRESVFGFQFFTQDNNNIFGTNTIPFVPNFNIVNAGVLSIQRINLNKKTLELGLRYDYQNINARGRDANNNLYQNELDFHNATFFVGIQQSLNDRWKISTNIASAWRPPQVGELYSFGKHQFNVVYGLWRYVEYPATNVITTDEVLEDSQKQIKSEKGYKWLTSIEFKKNAISWEVVSYVNYLQNYFFVRPHGITNTVRGPFPYFLYDQTDAVFYGMDLDVRLMHNAKTGSEVKVSFVRAKDLISNQAFIEIPPFNAQYNFSLKSSWASIEMGAEFTATQTNTPPVVSPDNFLESDFVSPVQIFDFMDAPRGYLLFNMGISKELRLWQFNVQMNNVFNTSYRVYTDRMRYFADDLGRNLKLSVLYRLSK